MTCDARIDNRGDLVSKLDISDRGGGIATDAELLLAAHRRWGEDFPRHFLGDFAAVVWNPVRRELIGVRDHFGVKPLYYVFLPQRLFAFASEVQALLALEEIPAEIDEDMVARHFGIPIADDPERTYYRHVRRMLPGHVLRVTEKGLAQRPYWELDLSKQLELSGPGEYAEALREVFVEAVRCRMRADSPIAAMLSGGLDSSAITCVAARIAKETGTGPLHTLSAEYPGVPESNERHDIDEILRPLDIVPHFFAADEADPIAHFDCMNRVAGGAVRGRNLYLNWELFGAAREAGARVVLDGFDGDSVVSHGGGYLHELAIAGKWLELARVSIPFSYRRGTSPLADYRSLVAFGRRQRSRRRNGSPAPKPPIPAVLPLAREFANRYVGRVEPPTLGSTEREIHGRHLRGPLLQEVLGWLEACGAGQGVEVRFPFFDVRVAELCVSLPPDQKLRRGWTRYVMRRALEGIVPASVQWRAAKANMYQGWKRAYLQQGAERVKALLADPNPAVHAYLDLPRVRELHERLLMGTASQAEEAALWRAVTLALWLSPQEVAGSPLPGASSSMRPRSIKSEQ